MDSTASDLASFLLDDSISSQNPSHFSRKKKTSSGKVTRALVAEVIAETHSTKPKNHSKQYPIENTSGFVIDKGDEDFFNSIFDSSDISEGNNLPKNIKVKAQGKQKTAERRPKKDSERRRAKEQEPAKANIVTEKREKREKRETKNPKIVSEPEFQKKVNGSVTGAPSIRPTGFQLETLLQKKNEIKQDLIFLEETLLQVTEPEEEIDDELLTMFRDYLQQAIFLDHYKRDYEVFMDKDRNGDLAMILSKKFELLSIQQKIKSFEKEFKNDRANHNKSGKQSSNGSKRKKKKNLNKSE